MQHVLYRRGGARAWTEVVGPNHVFVAGEAGSNAGVAIWCSGVKLGAMRCDATRHLMYARRLGWSAIHEVEVQVFGDGGSCDETR
jgi:hypothetical protein